MSALFPWLEPPPPPLPKPRKPRPTDQEILDAAAREDWPWFPEHQVHNDALFAALARAYLDHIRQIR